MKLKLRKGFTLLELLIVIAIIGILAVALLPTVTGAPKKARDAQRIAMVSNIAKAVETIAAAGGAYLATVGDGCLSAGANVTALQGQISNFSTTGPSNSLDTLCTDGSYYYKKLNDGYVVAAEVEVCSSGNVAGASSTVLKAAATDTVAEVVMGTATSVCAYAIVQTTN